MMVDAGGVVVEEEEEEVTHEVEVLAALVVDGVEGIGEVKGEKAVVNKSLSYGKSEPHTTLKHMSMHLWWD